MAPVVGKQQQGGDTKSQQRQCLWREFFLGTKAQGEEETPETVPPQIGPPRSGYFYYTVRAGDTLSELARDFDTTVLALLEYNDLPDEQTVFLGLDLRIPYGPPTLSDPAPPTPPSGTRFVVSLSRQQCWVL